MDIATKMQRDWDRRAREDARFWIATGHHANDEQFRESGRETARSLRSQLPDRDWRSADALEIGCGMGRILRELASDFRRLCGIDVSREMIERSREWLASTPWVETRAGSGVDLADFPTASFDLVYSYIAFQHMPRPVFARYLEESHRVLRPGGTLLFQIWAGAHIDAPLADTVTLRCYAPGEVIELLTHAGFASAPHTLRRSSAPGPLNLWWLASRLDGARDSAAVSQGDQTTHTEAAPPPSVGHIPSRVGDWLRLPVHEVASPLDTRLRMGLADERARSGWIPAALQVLRDLIDEQPHDPLPALAHAALLIRAGRPSEAEAELARILRHHPDLEPARRSLERLRERLQGHPRRRDPS